MSGTHDRETALGQIQQMADADLHFHRMRIDRRALAGVAFDRVLRVAADAEAHALGHQTIDQRALFVGVAHQIDAGAEGDHFDRHLVRPIGLQQIARDAENEAFFLRIGIGQLHGDEMLGEGLVRRGGVLLRGPCLRSDRARCK